MAGDTDVYVTMVGPGATALDDLRGAYRGRTAIVMGSGPSLARLPANDERIYRHVLFAVNGAIEYLPRADFFCSSDSGIMDTEWRYTLRESSCRIVQSANREQWPLNAVYGIPNSRGIWYTRRTDMRDYDMSPSRPDIILGTSSAHPAVHVALVLGCSRVYLVGCDCAYSGSAHHWWQLFGKPASRLLPVQDRLRFVDPNYDDIRNIDGHMGAWRVCWQRIKAANPGIPIVDCSGGALKAVFETASIESLVNT